MLQDEEKIVSYLENLIHLYGPLKFMSEAQKGQYYIFLALTLSVIGVVLKERDLDIAQIYRNFGMELPSHIEKVLDLFYVDPNNREINDILKQYLQEKLPNCKKIESSFRMWKSRALKEVREMFNEGLL